MKVLVSAASKHGATAEIARAIGDALGERGLEAEVLAPEEVGGLDDYGAVVCGSAVYAGHWLKEAKELAGRLEGDGRPVWIFSSGPIGDPPKPDEDPVDVVELLEKTRARGHRVFAGKLDREKLGFGERALVRALRAPDGDFRDWDEIRAWTDEIADELSA